ncbi:hypothetical protein GCM10027169_11430 [Gordonia jinhuaensis]
MHRVQRHDSGISPLELSRCAQAGDDDIARGVYAPLNDDMVGFLSDLVVISENLLGVHLGVDPDAVAMSTRVVAGRCAQSWFARTYLATVPAGEPVAVRVDLDEFQTIGVGPDPRVLTANAWLQSYWWARLTRDQTAIDLLAATPISAPGEGQHPDEAASALVRLLRRRDAGEPSWWDDPDSHGRHSRWDQPWSGIRDVLHTIGVQSRFTDALTDALRAHREHWSAPAFRAVPQGFWSLPLTALAAIAVEEGMSLEVDSEYLPASLITDRLWMFELVQATVSAAPARETYHELDEPNDLNKPNALDEPVPLGLVADIPAATTLEVIATDIEMTTTPTDVEVEGAGHPRIERHRFGLPMADLAAMAADVDANLADLRAELRDDPGRTIRLTASIAASGGAHHLAGDPRGAALATRVALRRAAQLHHAMFRLAALQPGEPAVIELDSGVVQTQGIGFRTKIANVPTWLDAYWFARATRNRAALETLWSVDLDPMRDQTRYDPALMGLIEVLSMRDRGDPAWAARAGEVLPEIERPVVSSWEQSQLLHLEVFSVLLSIGSEPGDQQRFTDALVDALRCHQKYWAATPKRSHDSSGYSSLALFGLASLAYDEGMRIEVDSDYLPMELIQHPRWMFELD